MTSDDGIRTVAWSQPLEEEAGISATGIDVGRTFLLLATLAFTPTSLFYFFADGGRVLSLAPGTIVACLVFVWIAVLNRVPLISANRFANYASFAGLAVLVILIHLVGAVAILGNGMQPERALLSIPVLLVLLGGAITLAGLLRRNAAALPRAIALLRWLLIGFSLLAVLGIQPFQGVWEKPVFPFSEPSHLALVLNPLLMHACVTSRGLARGLWLVGGVALAYLLQSLTMMIGMVVAALICLPMIGVFLTSAIAAAGATFLNLSYFTSRLNLGEGTRNLSALVYRQGWELISDSLQRTSGWGVGFQQLGYAPFRSPSADILYSILRDDVNTRDGGFLAAKIVSEFGVIGCVMVLAYVVFAARCTLLCRRERAFHAAAPSQVVFAWCIVCAFATEMFARDVGYFAGSVVLFLTALYMLWEHRSTSVLALPGNRADPSPLRA